MPLYLPERCLRNREDCNPLSQIEDEEGGFICCGLNDGSKRVEKQDKFTVCWKNNVIDEETHWDKRDIIDHISVLAQGLSVNENKELNQD